MKLSKPKKIFLLDGLGALLSAFLLGFVLVEFEPVFGIPKATLYCLAIIPLAFFIYDLYYYFKKESHISNGLKGIAILNLCYCLLSISCSIYHMKSITFLGWIYIAIEIFIIFLLAIFEYKIAKNLSVKSNATT